MTNSPSVLIRVAFYIAFSLSILFYSLPLHSEEIKDFYSEIFISADSSVNIEEKIEYDFRQELKHGIYREIPYKYQIGIQNYNLRMDVNKVADSDDNSYEYDVNRTSGILNVKIGDPDKEISGVHSYVINYSVDRAVIFFQDHDELYWNITGNEWKVPIRKAGAKVFFETAIPKGVKAACYTGYYGSKDADCSFDITPGGIEFGVSKSFNPGEGLTIVVGLPKGVLTEPSSFEKALWFVSDNWFFSLPFLTLFAMFFLWYTRGRDTEGKGAIAVIYEPPKNLTPAEAGTLIDERADIIDITSTVVDLAVRGYLKIEEIEGTKFVFLSDRDYRLIKIKEPAADELKAHEKSVFSGIFGGADEVMVSGLKNKFYTRLPNIKKSLYDSLVHDNYFLSNPDYIRAIYKWAGIGIIAAAFFLIPHWGIKLSVLLSGLLILIFSRYMPRKTKKGALIRQEILGFREFINRAERDRIERLAKDDPTLFDRVLPYALVFGLGDKWADAFRDMYQTPPSWYGSSRYGHSFTPNIFVNDIGRSLAIMNGAFASTPKRSGGSGFRGGSSGGGFGGGGGGSW